MCDTCGCGPKKDEKTFEQKVADLIQAVRPNLQSHGGDVELVAVEADNTVKVRLQGACSGCPGARMTLKQGIESYIKEQLPELKEIVAVE